MTQLGLDIGGANLKAATATGFAHEVAFPLWQQPGHLADELTRLIDASPTADRLAITMTGELADCYANKAEGVAAIVAAVEEAARGLPTGYYSLDGRFITTSDATQNWRRVAAANWHALALATVANQFDDGVLIDIGSTTTDVVSVRDGQIDGGGETDTERLLSGGLLYQGVGRTPICAVVDALPYRGRLCPVAAEIFATTADASMLLGHAEPSEQTDTADGRPMTKAHAASRLGRMLCADESEFNLEDALTAAEAIVTKMIERLTHSLRSREVLHAQRFVLSGGGEWLARRTLVELNVAGSVMSLSELIGHDASRCGPAWAVAKLAEGATIE